MAAYKKGAASSAVTVEERNNFAGAGQRLGDGSLAESARRGVAEPLNAQSDGHVQEDSERPGVLLAGDATGCAISERIETDIIEFEYSNPVGVVAGTAQGQSAEKLAVPRSFPAAKVCVMGNASASAVTSTLQVKKMSFGFRTAT